MLNGVTLHDWAPSEKIDLSSERAALNAWQELGRRNLLRLLQLIEIHTAYMKANGIL